MTVAHHAVWGAPAAAWSEAEAQTVWATVDTIAKHFDAIEDPDNAKNMLVAALATAAASNQSTTQALGLVTQQADLAVKLASMTVGKKLSATQIVEKTEELRVRLHANPAFGQLKLIKAELEGFDKIPTSTQLNRFIDEMANPSMCERSMSDFYMFRITFAYALALQHEGDTFEDACKHEDEVLAGTFAATTATVRFCRDMHVYRQILLKFPEVDVQNRVTYWNVYEICNYHPDPDTFLTQNSDVILRAPVPLLLATPKWSMANEAMMTQMRAALREYDGAVEGGSSPQAVRRHLPLSAQTMFKSRHGPTQRKEHPKPANQQPSPFTAIAVADVAGGADPYYVHVENGCVDLGNVLEGFMLHDHRLAENAEQVKHVKQLVAELQDAIKGLSTAHRRTRGQVNAQRHLTNQLATVVGAKATTRPPRKATRNPRGGAPPPDVKPELQKLVASVGETAKDKAELQATISALQRQMTNF